MIKLKIKLYLLVVMSVLGVHGLRAQHTSWEIPTTLRFESYFDSLDSIMPIKTYNLPFIDNAAEQARADNIKRQECGACNKSYYGKGMNVQVDLKTHGTLTTMPNGDNIWRLTFKSPSAYALQLYFDEFYIPENASLHAYKPDKSFILGGYTDENNPTSEEDAIEFGIQPVGGNELILEYIEPAGIRGGIIQVNNVVHVFRDHFEYSGPHTSDPDALLDCHLNVLCPEGEAWEKEISSVALILYYNENENLAGQCTGAVINNVESDGTPYFLTANHCADGNGSQYDFTDWLFLFNHHAQDCIGDGSEIPSSYIGESVRGSELISQDGSQSPTSDYLLLKLKTNEDELSQFRVCYSGWRMDQNPDQDAPFVGIHHPLSTVKKIATTYSNIVTDPVNSNYWHITFDDGITQGGSSGSPVYSNDKKIIGQLYGGAEIPECPPNSWQTYGKFDKSWTHGSFQQWLDPNFGGNTWVNTYCPTPSYAQGDPNVDHVSCGYVLGEVGMTVNGNTALNEIACADGDLTLRPYNKRENCEWPRWKWEPKSKKFKCNNIPSYADPSLCHPIPFPSLNKCLCHFYEYFIEIAEVDQFGNQISMAKSDWFIHQEGAAPYTAGPHFVKITQGTLAILQTTFEYGKYYRIKLAIGQGGWKEEVRVIRYCGENLTRSSNVTEDLYASSNITLTNATVNQDIQVVASNSINITSGTTLSRGEYRIESDLCNTETMYWYSQFKKENNTKSDSKETVVDEPIADESNSIPLESVIVFPNPAQDKLTVGWHSRQNEALNLKILDASGNVVKTIFENKMTLDGNHQEAIDIQDLSSGFYLTEISGDGLQVTKKFVVKR